MARPEKQSAFAGTGVLSEAVGKNTFAPEDRQQYL